MVAQIGKWLLIFFGALAVQSTLTPVINIYGVGPDLPIIALFFFATRFGMTPAIYVGFFLGLVEDLYSTSLLGQNALAKTVVGFFMGIFNERLMRTDPVIKLIILLIAFVIHDSLILGVDVFREDMQMQALLVSLLTRTLGRALYSMLLAMFITLWQHFTAPSLHT